MPTDALTGSRYPAATNAPNVPQDIQNAVFDLSDNTIPFFTSTTARDTAYTTWVSQGGVMRNGLYCDVSGIGLQRYTTGAWTTVVPTAVQRQAGTAGVTLTAANQDTGSVTFPSAFSTAPKVLLSIVVLGGSSVDLMVVMTGAPTASGFSWRVRERSATNVTVSATLHWFATL